MTTHHTATVPDLPEWTRLLKGLQANLTTMTRLVDGDAAYFYKQGFPVARNKLVEAINADEANRKVRRVAVLDELWGNTIIGD